ncbi:histidine kinase dimerization/phosphoacceptor domain -containing protein [Spirochaeta thermophila]|nr:histidine kinase dimerization/phosphoacceptor domain -containing protein [Spirochaeta thermophila]
MRFRTLPLVFLVVFGVGISSLQAEPNILFIHSYDPSYQWTMDIDRGVREELSSRHPEVTLYTEFYDTKHFAPEDLEQPFLSYLLSKYAGVRFSAVLASDDNALRFVLSHRAELFPYRPDIPVLFCGINDVESYDLASHPNVAGVAERIDIRGTLDLMLRLHPDLSLVAVVVDGTITGRINKELFLQAIPPYENRLSFVILENRTMEELLDDVRDLPEHSALLYLTFVRDREGTHFTPLQSLSLISDVSSRPVYTCWDFFMVGEKVVGGMVQRGALQGRELAILLSRLLEGEDPASLGVVERPLVAPLFRFEALQIFGIPLALLPQDAEVEGLPESVQYRFPGFFWSAILLGAILLSLLGLILFLFIRQRRTERLFRSLFQCLPDGALLYDTHGNILIHNRAAERIFGRSELDIKKHGLPGLLALSRSEVAALLSRQREEPLHTMQRDLAGEDGPKFVEIVSLPVSFHGTPAVLAIVRDMTDWQKTHQELERSIREKEILLKEVHHRVKNNLQIMRSLIQLQKTKDLPLEAVRELSQTQSRLSALAALHELLHRADGSERIRVDIYLSTIASQIASSLIEGPLPIEWKISAAGMELPPDTVIPLGLILNELITNSIKYAAPAGAPLVIEILLSGEERSYTLVYTDPGPSFDFERLLAEKNSLGFQLVKELARQLRGDITYRHEDGKNVFTLTFRA